MTGYAVISNVVYNRSGGVNKKRHGVLVRKFIRLLKREPDVEYRISSDHSLRGDAVRIEYWTRLC